MTNTRCTSPSSRLDKEDYWAIFVLGILATTLLAVSCGGSDSVPIGIRASFSGSGTAGQANRARLIGGPSSGNTVTIKVVCGETDNTDVYGFAFDLVLGDPSVVEYVAGSVDTGDAFSGNVIAAVQQNGWRIVVGITQTDQTGDRIPGPESVVVQFVLRALKAGTSEIHFENSTGSNPTNDPTAIDSSGDPIGTILFDAEPATVIGR